MTDEERQCEQTIVVARDSVRCARRGYLTWVHGKEAYRCWQHDPIRDRIDEGEEAYRDHQH
jgi:hypothetical protein